MTPPPFGAFDDAAEASPDGLGAGTVEARLTRLVRRECQGKTAKQVASISWGPLRKKLCDALDIEMTPQLKDIVLGVIAEEVEARE